MKTLLIVEDEPDLRELLRLTVEGFAPGRVQVWTVATAEAALEILATQKIDVVLTDQRLGRGATGAQLLGQVRESWPHIQRYLMTGFNELPPEEERQITDVSKDVLHKPISPLTLRDTLGAPLGL